MNNLAAPIIAGIITTCLCCCMQGEQPHRLAKTIYESGSMGDTSDWTMYAKPCAECTELSYKYDTNLHVLLRYLDEKKTTLIGRLFSYNKKIEGKCVIYNFDGKILWAEGHYKNGLKQGNHLQYYEDGKVKAKTNYVSNIPVYTIDYDANGNIVDSVTLTLKDSVKIEKGHIYTYHAYTKSGEEITYTDVR